jgi:hypothetical protein
MVVEQECSLAVKTLSLLNHLLILTVVHMGAQGTHHILESDFSQNNLLSILSDII